MNDAEIKQRLRGVDRGSIQVPLRKCNYSLGFERVPLDQSRESLTDNMMDEGYSNKYGSREQPQIAWEDYEIADEVPEDGLRSAIGNVVGTESSARVESLVGVSHVPHIEETIRCDPGENSVLVRFNLMEEEDLEEIAVLEDQILNKSSGSNEDQE